MGSALGLENGSPSWSYIRPGRLFWCDAKAGLDIINEARRRIAARSAKTIH